MSFVNGSKNVKFDASDLKYLAGEIDSVESSVTSLSSRLATLESKNIPTGVNLTRHTHTSNCEKWHHEHVDDCYKILVRGFAETYGSNQYRVTVNCTHKLSSGWSSDHTLGTFVVDKTSGVSGYVDSCSYLY